MIWQQTKVIKTNIQTIKLNNFLFHKIHKIETPFLLSNRSYKVGRNNPPVTTNAQTNDIQIESDLTVSRTHAEILIKFDEKHCDDLEQRAHIVLTDHSKFGTFVNDIRVDGFKQLNPNDVIRFGVNNTNFKYF